MNCRFRMIQFVPDPFSGARIPIGALVETDRGLEIATASELPSRDCLGGRATETLVQGIVEALKTSELDFDELPPKIGPQVRLGEPQILPVAGKYALEWLTVHVFPGHSDDGVSTEPER